MLIFMNINYHCLYIHPILYIIIYLLINKFIILYLYKIYCKILIYSSYNIYFILITNIDYWLMVHYNRVHFTSIIYIKYIYIVVPWSNLIFNLNFTAKYCGSFKICIQDSAKSHILKLFYKQFFVKSIYFKNPSAPMVKILYFSYK